MKKAIVAIACGLFISAGLFAQCIPDTSITHDVPGIYPDSATGLPHAIVGVPYSTVIQMKVVLDTTYNGLPAVIDSILILSVSGLPSGFSYSCTPTSCHFYGGSDACILLSGPAPTGAMAGQVYPLTVNVMTYGHVIGFPASTPSSISRYNITIDQNVGIPSLALNKFEVAQNSPNPFKDHTEISFSLPSDDFITVKISNLLGKQVYLKTIRAQKGLNKISLALTDLVPGIYIYNIGTVKNSVTRRMIVSGE